MEITLVLSSDPVQTTRQIYNWPILDVMTRVTRLYHQIKGVSSNFSLVA